MRGLQAKAIFRLRQFWVNAFFSLPRTLWLKALGMGVGQGTFIPHISVTWPHQVSIGDRCLLEEAISFKFDGPWMEGPRIQIGNSVFIGRHCEFNIQCSLQIGDDSLIASGCRFIDHDHGTQAGALVRSQPGSEASIVIGADVWIGANVVILKGVSIGDGAVIAAGAVCNKDVPTMEIWGGVPARRISMRK